MATEGSSPPPNTYPPTPVPTSITPTPAARGESTNVVAVAPAAGTAAMQDLNEKLQAVDLTPQQQQEQEEGTTEKIPLKPPSSSPVSREELTELVRAIKFAKPDASQRDVFREITEVIPLKKDGNGNQGYFFLKDAVQLNDVRKVWKKALQQQQKQKQQTQNDTSVENADLVEKLKAQGVVPQVFTVGSHRNYVDDAIGTTAIQTLAKVYTESLLSPANNKDESRLAQEAAYAERIAKDYVHVYLDVPIDRSGSRPHQALINFHKPAATTTAASSGAGNAGGGNSKTKSNKKKQSKKKVLTSSTNQDATAASQQAPFEGAIIVKIQMAAPLHANDTTKHPMLVYDQSKTYKTSVHYCTEPSSSAFSTTQEENQDSNNTSSESTKPQSTATTATAASTSAETTTDRGYDRLAAWIRSTGKAGALGQTGGTKAYFYGRLSTKTGGPGILSIYVKSLAPDQAW